MYTLYFAPDNASLIVRIVLEELGVAYNTWLVDRAAREQDSEAYRKLNPNGLIPVCIIDGEPVFETAAIVLSLADRHGALAPPVDDPVRPMFLKWLFFLSNTVHSDLRLMFYPAQYVGPDSEAQAPLDRLTRERLRRHFALLEEHYEKQTGPYLLGETPTVVDIYLGLCLRWPQLYPTGDQGVFRQDECPALSRMASALQQRPTVARSFDAEGIPAPYLLGAQYPDGSRGAAL